MDKRARTRLVAAALFTFGLTSLSPEVTVAARPPHEKPAIPAHPPHKVEPHTPADVREAYARMPLRFERTGNRERGSEFVARGSAYTVGIASDVATLVVGSSSRGRAAIEMRLIGAAHDATATVRHLLPGVTNYVIGSDPRQWRTGIRSYGVVEYSDIYPGVSIVYYGNQQQLEYDFIVKPGASHRHIVLSFDRASRVTIDSAGNLAISTDAGTIVQRAPVIYQDTSNGRRIVRGGYVRRGRNRFAFWVGQHDPGLPLVIDPVLTYATYVGGANEERAAGVGLDAQGNIYLTGLTGAADFPITAAADLQHRRADWNAFVLKLNPTGDQFLYATYLGGSGYEEPSDLEVDAEGSVYLIGTTDSWDFPTVHAIQPSRRGYNDSFVTKLDAVGGIVYSTYLGGHQEETGGGIAVDSSGRAYVTGATFSADFPTVNALQPSLAGSPAFRTMDGGNTWTAISDGLSTTVVLTFAIDPSQPSTVYAGSHSDGVFKSTDGGSTWMPASADLPPLPVNALAVDAEGTVYAANDFSLFRSRDGGASWTDTQLWTRISSLGVDAAASAVYAGAPSGYYRQGVFKSIDGGETWTDTGLDIGVSRLSIGQSVVYAGTDFGVFKSAGGNGWEAAGLNEMVTAIAANPNDSNEVYAGTFNGLFYTASGGTEWSVVPALANAAVTSIAVGSNASTVYVSTWGGSAVTDDGGATWRSTGPVEVTYAYAIDPAESTRVYAGSYVSGDVFIARISPDGSTLEYSTYLGGTGSEWASDISVDAAGAAYVAGTTQSNDFPVLNPFQATAGGLMDVFAAKLSASGALAYATYVGGGGSDYSPRVAVDSAGQLHVVGVTLSTNFAVANAYQPSHGGGHSDVFVTTLNAAGSGLVFSTFLGGNDQEVDWTQSLGPAVAVGPGGETIVTGTTRSGNFPTRDAIQPAHAGGSTDAFVARFDSAGQLQDSTYLGGSADDYGRRVTSDPAGGIIVAGATMSADFPTWRAVQTATAGAADVFLARIADQEPDTVAPTITIDSPRSADYVHTDAIQVSFSAADSESGLASGSPAATLDGSAVASGETIELLTLALGSHTVTVSASDNAGNRATRTVEFRVTATIDSLIEAVDVLTAQGQITTAIARSLLAKLSDAKAALESGRVAAARGKLEDFESQVSAQSGRSISSSAAQLLLDDAAYVLGAL